MKLTEQALGLQQVIEALEIGDELFWEPSRQAIPGSWTGHIAIAFWLIKAVRPSMFVELGTHSGNSYSAFCQAIAQFGLQARAFAVDTWRGDEHAGLYGEEVFKELHAFNESHFAGFSKLLRTTFDDARNYLPDRSIDLLHIDGLHTYDAVKRDFDTWKSALSATAVVVFHDTNVRERDFGVWKLWQELAQIYPSFEFHHSEGLGVLGFGERQTCLMKRLFELGGDSQSAAIVRRIFASRGETFRNRSQVLDLSLHFDLASNDLRHQSHRVSVLEQELAALGQELAARDATLRDRDQQIQNNAEAINSLQQGLVSRDATLAEREEEIQTKTALIADLEQELVRRDDEIQQQKLTIVSKDQTIEARQRRIAQLGDRAAELRRQLEEATDRLAAEKSAASERVESLQGDLADVQKKLGLIESSTAWEIASRISSALHPFPKVRLYARRIAHVLWWTVTFQLIARLRDRRRLFAMRDKIAASTLFDGTWYLSQYPEIAEAGCDPALHYALYGATECRNPGPRFDAAAYLQRYSDVVEVGANPLLHYLEHGAHERRIISRVGAPPDVPMVEPPSFDYQTWVARYDTISDADRAAIIRHLKQLEERPLISIVMPVYNTNPTFLRKALDSVLAQLYPAWELCIADDASTNPEIRTILNEYALRDERIKVAYRSQNGHISAASNSALELVTGEFVALMDHDDELSVHALYMVALELNAYPEANIIYSDEDQINDEGGRSQPHFKTEWNSGLFYSYNLINHLGVYRTLLVRQVGGFREGFEGSQDYDLALRVLDYTSAAQIRHIPHILYHWRIAKGLNTFSTDFLSKAVDAARRTLSEYFTRRGETVEVVVGSKPYINRLIRPLPDPLPLVSLIVPTRDRLNLLRNCIDGLLHHTRYKNLQVIIVDNGSQEPETLAYLQSVQSDGRVRVLRIDGPFNFSSLNNRAVAEAQGAIVGFVNNDIEVIEPNWLEEMVSHAIQPRVGAVGAKLLYANNTIQHAGVVVGLGGVAGHGHKGCDRSDFGYMCRLKLAYHVTCVTAACMIMPKKVFEEVGGFDEVNLKVAFNDVDLCLKIRSAGYDIIWTPYAELYHLESATRGSDEVPEHLERAQQEQEFMKARWGAMLQNDPYYSPNLTYDYENYALAFPPRTDKPWRQAGQNANI